MISVVTVNIDCRNCHTTYNILIDSSWKKNVFASKVHFMALLYIFHLHNLLKGLCSPAHSEFNRQ